MGKKLNRFSLEMHERAVRMVQEHRGEFPSLWDDIELIAPKEFCVPPTLYFASVVLKLPAEADSIEFREFTVDISTYT